MTVGSEPVFGYSTAVAGGDTAPIPFLRWQCRRGMRELDLLLSHYLDHDYGQANDRQKQAFRELLALPDPALIAYLLGGHTPPDNALANIVEEIRRRSHA